MAGNIRINIYPFCKVEMLNDSKNNAVLGHYTCLKCKKGYNFFQNSQNYINKNQHNNQKGLDFD